MGRLCVYIFYIRPDPIRIIVGSGYRFGLNSDEFLFNPTNPKPDRVDPNPILPTSTWNKFIFFNSFHYLGFKPDIQKHEFLWVELAPNPELKNQVYILIQNTKSLSRSKIRKVKLRPKFYHP